MIDSDKSEKDNNIKYKKRKKRSRNREEFLRVPPFPQIPPAVTSQMAATNRKRETVLITAGNDYCGTVAEDKSTATATTVDAVKKKSSKKKEKKTTTKKARFPRGSVSAGRGSLIRC